MSAAADLRATQARRLEQAGSGGGPRVVRGLAGYKRPPTCAVGARVGDEHVRLRGHWARRGALCQTSGVKAPLGGGAVRRLIVNREDKRSSGKVRHVRMLGLCLVAVFALAAMAASSALAGPQWVKCEKVGPGHNYSGPNCTKSEKAKPKGSGEYELYKGKEIEAKRVAAGKSPGVPFTGHNEGSGGLLSGSLELCETEGGEWPTSPWTRKHCEEANPNRGRGANGWVTASVECHAESSSGEAAGTSEVKKVHVKFTGCNLFETIPCDNTGPEEINTSELKGKLGYINKAAKEVGVLLEPVAKHGAFATFECGNGLLDFTVGVGNDKEGTAWVQGTRYPTGCVGYCKGATPEEEKHGGYDGVISPIVPVNQMTSTYTQEYKDESPGGEGATVRNVPTHFEGKHIEVLEVAPYKAEFEGLPVSAYEWAAASETITNVVTPEEESEISA